MPNYEDFEIVVEKVSDADIYAVNVRQACGGKAGDASSSFKLDEIIPPPAAVEENNSEPPTRHIVFSGGLKKDYTLTLTDSLTEKTARNVGLKLTQAVFKKEIAELWGKCQRYAPLRIRLDLTRAPELAALPWEYLRLTDDSNFAGLDKDATILRYLRTTDAVRPLKIIPPLRILLMAAAPQDLPQLDLNKEIVEIKNALSVLAEQNIEIVVLPQATGESLRTTLQKAQDNNQPFHIFHFIGHGAFDPKKQEGVLLFENAERKSVAVGHEDLGRWLQPFRSDLRLIVLNACEGARLSITDAYSSVAAKIMQIAEIPAAIAMQFRITDAAAIVFAKTFYRQIAAGENLEYAVDAARLAVNNLGGAKQEWATPVFYLRADSGHLLDVKIPKPPPKLAAHYETLKVVLPTCKLVVFLGLNVNAVDRPFYDFWEPRMGVPTAAELCSYLGRQYNLAASGNSLAGLAQAIQLRKHISLSDEFNPIFGALRMKSQKTSRLYRTLAQLTKKITDGLSPDGKERMHKSLLFVTTTYDNALEKAFGENGVGNYHLIRYERDDKGSCLFSHREYENGNLKKQILLDSLNMPNQYTAWRDTAPVILKLPGEVGEDSEFAVTEDDFFAFAGKKISDLIPPDVLTQVKESRHLYLGYDLQSWTLRLLRNRICEGQSGNGKKGSYAVVFDEDDDPNALFWRESEVNFATATLEDYVAGLEQNVLQQL